MMARIIASVLLAASLLALGGCASSEDDPNRVSTIPWNRPERWEGQGPMGGMLNPEQGY